jgi:hypothetical protein
MALMLPHAEPTPYGLGKSGWVSLKFPDGNVPVEMLKAWIDESYRAQAPKKLVASLGATTHAPPKAAAASPKKKPAKKK